MTKTALLAATAAIALTAGGASAADLHPHMMAKGINVAAHQSRHVGPGSVFYTQNSGATSTAVVSDNFTSGFFSSGDSALADDFVYPGSASGGVTEVDVTGAYFNGSGPATSVTVSLYKSKKASKKIDYARPGKLMYTITESCSNGPSFSCTLPLSKGKAAWKLKSGKTYWISVVANVAFFNSTGSQIEDGEWGWATRTPVVGADATWENPNGGWGVGCTTWEPADDCGLGLPEAQDLMFSLSG